PQGKQNPLPVHVPFRGRPLGLFGFGASACSAVAFGGRPLPVSGRAAGSWRNARQSTPKPSSRTSTVSEPGVQQPFANLAILAAGPLCTRTAHLSAADTPARDNFLPVR